MLTTQRTAVRLSAPLLALLMLPVGLQAASIVSPIDDFKDVGQSPTEAPTSAGWDRSIEFDMLSNPNNQSGSVVVNPIADGYLVVSLGPGVIGTTRVSYSATSGNVNLTNLGANALSFGVGFSDISTRFSATVYDINGNAATASYQSTQPITNDTEVMLEFSDFANRSSTDFSVVSDIVFEFEPASAGADLVIDLIGTSSVIPEPAPIVLTLLTALCLLTRRKRR